MFTINIVLNTCVNDDNYTIVNYCELVISLYSAYCSVH